MSELAATLADAVIERVAIDWQGAGASTRGADAATLRAFQDIATLARVRETDSAKAREGEDSVGVSSFTIVVATLGAVVTLTAFAGTFVRLLLTAMAIPLPQVVVVLSFAGTAAVLVAVAQRTARVIDYAALCLLTAAAFARPLLRTSLGGVFPEVFLPAAMWGFAQRFPYTYRFSRVDRMARILGVVAAAFGVIAFVVNVVVSSRLEAVHSRWAVVFLRSDPLGVFWLAFYALMFPALLCIAARCWHADRAERRRVASFGAAIALGTTPIVLAGIVQVSSPAYRALMIQHAFIPRIVDTIVWAGLISIPITTGLSVARRGALPVRRLAADALRFVIARNSLKALSVLLALGVAARFIRDRDRPLAESLRWAASYPFAAATALALLFIGHRAAGRWIQRLFGRRIVDHERQGADAVARVGAAGNRQSAAVVVTDELRRAFDPRTAAVLFRDSGGIWTPAGFAGQPLGAASSLPWLAMACPHGASVRPGSPTFELLPADDQRWVLRGGIELVVSIGRDQPWGLVALGSRPDCQPYDRSDQLLVSTIVGAAANAAIPNVARSASAPALECPACGVVSATAKTVCGCDVEPSLAALPYLVSGKFELVRRVGSGGMGIVYLATDRLIGRPVALKTVHVSGPDRTERVLLEARAMASAVHSHLAQIHSVELVGDAPVLVVEWMPAGTLADRLSHGRLEWNEAMAMGQAIASALAHLHAAGLTHQDVKPSNIAFAADGSPKLLDFGLASAVAGDAAAGGAVAFGVEGGAAAVTLSLAGTPLYLSPDLLAGAAGGPHQDLWALALVLYEAIAGCNPFMADTVRATVRRIRTIDLPDVRRFASDVPALVADFLMTALSRDARRRPITAADMARTVHRLRE